jgi:hypothetical protein
MTSLAALLLSAAAAQKYAVEAPELDGRLRGAVSGKPVSLLSCRYEAQTSALVLELEEIPEPGAEKPLRAEAGPGDATLQILLAAVFERGRTPNHPVSAPPARLKAKLLRKGAPERPIEIKAAALRFGDLRPRPDGSGMAIRGSLELSGAGVELDGGFEASFVRAKVDPDLEALRETARAYLQARNKALVTVNSSRWPVYLSPTRLTMGIPYAIGENAREDVFEFVKKGGVWRLESFGAAAPEPERDEAREELDRQCRDPLNLYCPDVRHDPKRSPACLRGHWDSLLFPCQRLLERLLAPVTSP